MYPLDINVIIIIIAVLSTAINVVEHVRIL